MKKDKCKDCGLKIRKNKKTHQEGIHHKKRTAKIKA